MIVRWSRRPVAPPSARAVAHRMPPLVVGSVAIGLAILRSPWWLFLLVPAGLSATPLGASATRRIGDGAAAIVWFVAGSCVAAVAVGIGAVQRVAGLGLRGPQGWWQSERCATPMRRWSGGASGLSGEAPAFARIRLLTVIVVGGLAAAMFPPVRAVWTVDRVPPSRAFRLAAASSATTAAGEEPPDAVDPELPASPASGVFLAHQGDDWAGSDALSAAQGWLLDPRGGWRPYALHRMLDVRSEYVNIVDGHRLSWRPPECNCRRVKVAMYGGSTTWGLEQRDAHTVASELARVAAERGLTIDVDNAGQCGHLHWMEAEHLAADLAAGARPDLVVFYDGVNDAWSSNVLNDIGSSDIPQLFDPTTIDLWNSSRFVKDEQPSPPQGAKLIGRARPAAQPSKDAQTVVARYDRSRRTSEAVLRDAGIAGRYFWQPNRLTRPLVLDEPHGTGTQENDGRLLQQQIRAALPPDVVDLGDVLDGDLEPTYTDDVHHNERGARTIAEAMFVELEPELRRLAGAGDR